MLPKLWSRHHAPPENRTPRRGYAPTAGWSGGKTMLQYTHGICVMFYWIRYSWGDDDNNNGRQPNNTTVFVTQAVSLAISAGGSAICPSSSLHRTYSDAERNPTKSINFCWSSIKSAMSRVSTRNLLSGDFCLSNDFGFPIPQDTFPATDTQPGFVSNLMLSAGTTSRQRPTPSGSNRRMPLSRLSWSDRLDSQRPI